MLTLYEQLLLLSIHEDKGIFIGSYAEGFKPGVVGAILAELTLSGKIRTTKNSKLELVDGTPTEDPILDGVLEALRKSEKQRKFGYWINTLFIKPEKLRKQIVNSLVQKGILSQEDDHLQWVIPSAIELEVKASAKYDLIKRLRGVVIAREEPQLRDIALLSLVSASGWLDLVFLRDERKLASRNINELVVGQAMNDPIIETIQEIGAAISAEVEED